MKLVEFQGKKIDLDKVNPVFRSFIERYMVKCDEGGNEKYVFMGGDPSKIKFSPKSFWKGGSSPRTPIYSKRHSHCDTPGNKHTDSRDFIIFGQHRDYCAHSEHSDIYSDIYKDKYGDYRDHVDIAGL